MSGVASNGNALRKQEIATNLYRYSTRLLEKDRTNQVIKDRVKVLKTRWTPSVKVL
jgi:hypothetical protein